MLRETPPEFLQKWTILHICIWYKYILIDCLGIYLKMCALVDYFHIFQRLKIVSRDLSRKAWKITAVRWDSDLRETNLVETFLKALAYPHLYYVDLSDNELHGELAWKWEQFNNLTMFRISGKKISGEIPAALGKTTYLQSLDLSSNQLVGRIPKELGILKLIDDNKLSGDIPFDVEHLSNLERLGLVM